MSEASILVAEPDVTFGDLLTTYLSARGYAVRRAIEGRSALAALLRGEPPIAAIADLELPNVDALEIAATAAVRRPLPIVLTTTDPAAARWSPSLLAELGIAAVVRRPCPLSNVVEVLERVTGHRAPRESVSFQAIPRIA